VDVIFVIGVICIVLDLYRESSDLMSNRAVLDGEISTHTTLVSKVHCVSKKSM